MRLAWIPNALTLARCGLAVIAAGAVTGAALRPDLASERSYFAVALGAFLLAALTDLLDGLAARALKAVSAFGTWLDPIADKLLVGLVLAAFAGLYAPRWTLLVPVAVILARDLYVTFLRTRLGGGYALAPSSLAKWKTALEMLAITGLLAFPLTADLALASGLVAGPLEASRLANRLAELAIAALWLAAALSAVTGFHYAFGARGTPDRTSEFD